MYCTSFLSTKWRPFDCGLLLALSKQAQATEVTPWIRLKTRPHQLQTIQDVPTCPIQHRLQHAVQCRTAELCWSSLYTVLGSECLGSEHAFPHRAEGLRDNRAGSVSATEPAGSV